jgi:phosphatidylglycerol lysyltransferase
MFSRFLFEVIGDMLKRLLRRLGPILGLILFAAAVWVLHRELVRYRYHDIVSQLRAIPPKNVLVAVALTLLSYLLLTFYDQLAFRYIRRPTAYGKVALASFIGYAFSNSMGHGFITGGTVRYRLHTGWGLSAIEVTKVVAFLMLTFGLGMSAIGGLALLVEPTVISSLLHLPPIVFRSIGVILLALVGVYASLGVWRSEPLSIQGWEFHAPSLGLSLSQLAIASLDWVLTSSVLYVLLPPSSLSYPAFLGVYLLAQAAGLASLVPGGLGVFEGIMVLSLSSSLPTRTILGALIAYRGIYYLLPLGTAILLLGAHELAQKKEGLRWAMRFFGRWVPELVPQLLSVTTFIGGAILLFSGAVPAISERMIWLSRFLPLPVVEVSHFLGSLAGIGLLLLARGLQQRLDAAYFLTATLLVGGIFFSLLKGFDYEEAIILAAMLGSLLPCRGYFYRKTSLTGEPFTPGWIVAIFLVLAGSVWLGMFTHRHVEFSAELWWRFSLSGDAPRALRATVGAIVTALIFSVSRLLRPALQEPALPGPEELELASIVLSAERKTSSRLVFLGDKAILFNGPRTAFIMYAVEKRSWVALGDPVGPQSEMAELVWRFRELSDRHDGWSVFYQVGREHLPLYLDVGLTLLKIGEEARVPLERFSLEGGERRGLRHSHHRVEKEGCAFEVVPQERVPPLLEEFKRISDAWLSAKNTREKKFSVGFFDPDYLKQFPAAVIWRGGKAVAFANVLTGAERGEISVDLMRHLPDEAPSGVMDFLFIELMLWGKREGYRYFNLGMSPFSGLEARTLSPLWSRIGALIFRYGEHFYNFQGLREYKDKFGPEWEPKYLATPGGLVLPRVLTDIASLIAGGL